MAQQLNSASSLLIFPGSHAPASCVMENMLSVYPNSPGGANWGKGLLWGGERRRRDELHGCGAGVHSRRRSACSALPVRRWSGGSGGFM